MPVKKKVRSRKAKKGRSTNISYIPQQCEKLEMQKMIEEKKKLVEQQVLKEHCVSLTKFENQIKEIVDFTFTENYRRIGLYKCYDICDGCGIGDKRDKLNNEYLIVKYETSDNTIEISNYFNTNWYMDRKIKIPDQIIDILLKYYDIISHNSAFEQYFRQGYDTLYQCFINLHNVINKEQIAKDDFLINMISKNPDALQFMIDPSYKAMLKATEIDGLILRYIKNQTLQICLMAVEKNPLALEFVNWSIFDAYPMLEKFICEKYAEKNPMCIQYFSPRLKKYYNIYCSSESSSSIFTIYD